MGAVSVCGQYLGGCVGPWGGGVPGGCGGLVVKGWGGRVLGVGGLVIGVWGCLESRVDGMGLIGSFG